MISILVPTYNQANFLPAALDSLLAQTFSNWEAIVVNDGSTDDTAQVAEAYASRDRRIRVVHQQNGGVATALNAGLRHAYGEWICWLSSDDLFEPDKLAVHATFAAENPAARFMYTSFSLLYEETGAKDLNALNTSVIPSLELQVLQLFRFNYVNGISIAVHREVFERVGKFSEYLKNGQDYDMWLRISAHFPLHFINKRTSITRMHPSQGTNLFVEAGIYDSCQAGFNFLNQYGFAALFPFLDLRRAENVLFAIQNTVGVLTEPSAYINRCGGTQAMADRLHEWLSESSAEIRAMVIPYLAEAVRIVAQSGLPETIRRVFCSLEPVSLSFKYQRHDFFELLRQHIQNLEKANHNEAPAMRKYLSYYVHDAEQSPPPDQQILDNTAPAHDNHFFIESALAHKYCIGKGLEIGGSAHNPFGLNTLNVDFSDSKDTIYKQEEVRACGKAMPVDIVAPGDNIPLPDESQDFIVSSHVLEHFPNPIKALKEWYRLIKPGGIIFMIVPHKERTFDSIQPRTTLEHLVQDYYNDETKFHENPQGHDHCWITEDILEMLKWMTSHLDMHWKLVEVQDVDDKVGNGFTFVLKKDDALPISVVEKPAPSECVPKSVLFVVHGFPPIAVGGVEVYTRNLAKEMTSRGIRVTVLYPTTDSSEPAYSTTSDITDGLTLAKFDVPRGNLFTSIISQDIDRAFGRFLKSHSFDLIHFHHIFEHLSLSMIATAKETGVPVALTLHDFWFICPRAQLFIEENGTVCSGPESPAKCANCIACTGWFPNINLTKMEQELAFRQEYVRELLLKVDLLFSPSNFVADVFSKHAFGDNRITVAPLGIGKFTVNRFSSGAGTRFGYMGTIHPVKNILPLVRAFAATYGPARLDIYGGGETHRVVELINCISDSRIAYHGSYTSEQLPEILSNIDTLIVPSLIESYCFTVREALSAGIPVLAARVGGIPEIIRNGVNGILFDPCDNRELTSLLQQFINDRSLLRQLNVNAILVKTITADAEFLLEQYSYRMNRSGEQALETNAVAVEQKSNLSLSTPIGELPNKIKVAAFSMDPKEQACGYYRVLSPLAALEDEIEPFWGIELRGNSYHIELAAVETADLFVVQRFFPQPDTADFLNYLCSLGKPIIFEIDDLLTQLPPTNPNYAWGVNSALHIYEFIRKCAAVTVSTEELKKHFSPYNGNIYILPNLLDSGLWHKPPPPSSGPVVIGYAGTITHNTDLTLLEDVLEQIASRYGDRVAFTFMGCATERISRLPGFSFIQFETTFEAYARKLQEIPIDIMLIPLEDNPFNRCKSNIKWLEYSACGIAGIYADLTPYNTCVKQGDTGILVGNTTQQWFDAIDLLISKPELRRTIALNACHKVMSEYTLNSGAHRWLEVYREILEQHGGKPHVLPLTVHTVKVSIIIPVFNQLLFTKQCLDGLFATLPTAIPCEIIVVDNGSSDGTMEYLRSLSDRITVLSNRENVGFAKACNQGARTACGELVLFLNNDTVPKPGWIEALIAAIENDEADICGARLLYPDGRCQHAGIAFNEQGLGYHIFSGFPGDATPVVERRFMQAVTGACMVLRKTLFHELDGFDEGFRNGFEDVDICLRAGENGKRILYVPESVVIHYAEQSSGRKDNDVPNMQRFFTRWQGKVRQDDMDLYARFGLTSSREPDGRIIVTPAVKSSVAVSIIIPLFNKVGLTWACLKSLERTTSQGSYELVLVDNGSSDGTAALLKEWEPKAIIIRNSENKGFAAACNQGARAATGKYLLFLNNDTEVTASWLEPLVETLDNDPTVAAAGSKLLFPDGTLQHAGVVLVNAGQKDPLVALHRFFRFAADYPQATIPWQMQALTAACLLLRREIFEVVGGFDEGYWNGYEDVDLCLRLGQAGSKLVYQPASVVVHYESQSGPERFSKVQHNIMRLHDRWLKTISPDLLMAEDGSLELGPAMLEGVCAPYKAPDHSQPPSHSVQTVAPVASTVRVRYPLIPLVGQSSSSILQKLSSSQRLKGVLKLYMAEE